MITRGAQLAAEAEAMRKDMLAAPAAAQRAFEFVENPDAYRAEYRESEEELEREDRDHDLTPPVPRSYLAIARTAWH